MRSVFSAGGIFLRSLTLRVTLPSLAENKLMTIERHCSAPNNWIPRQSGWALRRSLNKVLPGLRASKWNGFRAKLLTVHLLGEEARRASNSAGNLTFRRQKMIERCLSDSWDPPRGKPMSSVEKQHCHRCCETAHRVVNSWTPHICRYLSLEAFVVKYRR